MNLLNVLLKAMLAKAAIDALSKKTGLSSAQLSKLIPLAIPLLLRFMTNNASTQSGALSLLGALAQHTNTRSLDEQFLDADVEDGAKILKHILGDDSDRAVETLAAETDMSSEDVSRALGGLAPALLSVLSAATSSASANQPANSAVNLNDGLDLSEMLSLFGGASQAQQTAQQPGLGLLGSLLGASQPQQQSASGASLLDALLGVTPAQPVQQPVQQSKPKKPGLLASLFGATPEPEPEPEPQPVLQPSASLLGSLLGLTPAQPVQQPSAGLLGSLLGASQPVQQPVQQSLNNLNGNTLLSLLLGAMQ